MDWWDLAIRRNRAALLGVAATLFFMAGLDEGGADVLPRRIWRRIVDVLRPAESALRRLIVVAALGIEVAPPRLRPPRPPAAGEELQAAGLLVIHENVNFGLARAWLPPAPDPAKAASRIPAFPLTDPPRRFDPREWAGLRSFPRDGFAPADGEEPVDATHLCRRLLALKAALDDLDRIALRLARREARIRLATMSLQGAPAGAGKRPAARAGKNPWRKSPHPRRTLRLGDPPGHRQRATRPIDELLTECHTLALTRARADTS